jgi:diguanylate cyclase (GGDEF)-like protein
MLAGAMDWISEFSDRAVSGGYLVAVVLICALQYVYHLFSLRRAARIREQFCREIDDVHDDLRAVSRDRTLTSLENQILREFTRELDLDRILDQLLRRFMADAKDGFAAYLPLDQAGGGACRARGLSNESRRTFTVDPKFVTQIARDGVLLIERSELAGSRLFDGLSATDRTRFNRLFLAAVGDLQEPAGVIVTTSLFPNGIPLDQQMELARRLTQSLSGIIRRTKELRVRDKQLQSITENMELRSVADRKHDSPLLMIEAIVDRLREMSQAERAVLFLITPDGTGPYKALCRCGIQMPGAVAEQYSELETSLAELAVKRNEPALFDAPQLARAGIRSLIGSAIVSPVATAEGIAGALCLSRKSLEPFAPTRAELIRWAARYLSETLGRVLHQSVSEWHARQDALTGLSNRRTFDQELPRALQAALHNGTTCALLMLDVDHFKSINDGHGHLAGDEVLRSISRLLKESAAHVCRGGSAIAARYGGEEFVLLLPGFSCDQAVRLGETIRAAVEARPVRVGDTRIQVTMSAGVGVFPDHGRTAQDLIAAADSALYQAKESGRNCVLAAATHAECHS